MGESVTGAHRMRIARHNRPGTGVPPTAALGLDCLANDRRETWDTNPRGRVRIPWGGGPKWNDNQNKQVIRNLITETIT